MTFVTVCDGEEKIQLEVKSSNLLSLKVVNQYFFGATGLTYTSDGVKLGVQLDEEENHLILPVGIKMFHVYYPKSLIKNAKMENACSELKLKRRANIIAEIRGKTPHLDEPLINKDVIPKKEIHKKPTFKNIIVGWKHQSIKANDYEAQRVRDIKLTLDCTAKYSIDQIKDMAINAVVDEENYSYFENCTLNIGTHKKILTEFTDDNNKVCDFWKFVQKIRTKNHQIRIYVYSKKDWGAAVEENVHVLFYKNKNKTRVSSYKKDFALKKDKNNEKEAVGSASSVKNESSMNEKKIQVLQEQKNPIGIEKSCSNPLYSSFAALTKINKNKVTFASKNSLNSQSQSKSRDIEGFHSSFKFSWELSRCEDKKNFSKENYANNDNDQKIIISSSESASSLEVSPKNSTQISENIFEDVSIPVIETENLKQELQIFTDKKLGKGSYGVVFKGLWRNCDVAVKKMKVPAIKKSILREIAVMDKLRHPNIVTIMAICLTPKFCYLVLEYFDSLNLREALQLENKEKYKFDEAVKNKIGLQICKVIAFLHASNIMHKDIKLDNILVNTVGFVKVCDFGLSRFKEMPSALETLPGCYIKGTPMYMSPEILNNQPGQYAADVWALACLLIEMYREKDVWGVEEDLNVHLDMSFLKKTILTKKIPDLDSVPINLHGILKKCFNVEVKNRATVNDILQAYNFLDLFS